jgi:hypothetical protein
VPSKIPTTSPNGAFPEDSFKYSPLEHVRSLFVGFFQGLFHAAPYGAYHWEPNDEHAEIYISDENPIKAETVGQRPAISCTRGPVQFYSLGLDDMLTYDFQTGTKKKSVLVPGTMVVNCSSRAALESERIAWICAEQLWLHRELLMQAGFFEIGRQPAIGAPSPAGSVVSADSGDEWYVTTVNCPYQFYRTSQFSPLGKTIVRNMGLSIRAQLQSVNQQLIGPAGAPVGSSENNSVEGGHCGPAGGPTGGVPVNIHTCPPDAFAPQASDVYGATPRPGGAASTLPLMPHPLNPAQQVIVRAARPNCPAVRPPSIGGRTIPIAVTTVEESCVTNANAHVTDTSTVKV